MRIPGFTAEASLKRTSEGYRMTLTPTTEERVVPQMFCHPTPGGGYICCQCYMGYCWCFHPHPVLQ